MQIKVSSIDGGTGYWSFSRFKEEIGAEVSDYKTVVNVIDYIVYEINRPLTFADFIKADNHGLKFQILADTMHIKLTFRDKDTEYHSFKIFETHVKKGSIWVDVIDDEIDAITCEMNNPLTMEDYALAEKLGFIINLE